MKVSTLVDVVTFLANELTRLGFNGAEVVADSSGSGDWRVERDEFGFTLTAPTAAHTQLQRFLATACGAARFTSEGAGPRIYRRDDLGVTVMLATDDDAVKVIVLVWKNPQIYAKMQSMVHGAINAEIGRALEQCAASLDEAAAADDAQFDAKLDDAMRQLSDVVAAIDRCGETASH
jgi:hypothetical protein